MKTNMKRFVTNATTNISIQKEKIFRPNDFSQDSSVQNRGRADSSFPLSWYTSLKRTFIQNYYSILLCVGLMKNTYVYTSFF